MPEVEGRGSFLRIATYNVRNLVSAEPVTGAGSGVAGPSDGKSRVELRALQGTVAALGADVLLLQEVGSNADLQRLNDGLASPYPFAEVLPGNSERGIHLAILSREPFRLYSHRQLTLTDESGLPLHEYVTEADAEARRPSPLRLQRDLMLAEIALDGEQVLALFNVHLKSRTNRPWRLLAADVIRAAECRAIAERLSAYGAQHPTRPLLLGGDFNDTLGSPALTPLLGLAMTDPVGAELAAGRRSPSTYWPKRRMRLDHLLVDGRLGARVRPGSARIHASERARRASDHYPVSLDLSVVADEA